MSNNYQIVLDGKEKINCFDYSDMIFKSWRYRLEGHEVVVVITKK